MIIFFFFIFLKQAGRGLGVVARGRVGGPLPRGQALSVRLVATGVRGPARGPVLRGLLHDKGNSHGKFIYTYIFTYNYLIFLKI